MGLELRDAMKISPFSKAVLVAGHTGLTRTVVSANIQEVPTVDRWLKGGEILFTAGYAFQSAEKGCEMMERLNQVGIAALAIKPGQYLPQIPNEMIECSNRLGLPLFELPADLPYMDCIIAIFERITQEQLSVLRRVERMHTMLTQTILNKEGLDGICDILYQVTSCSVFITGPTGELFAHKTTASSPEELDSILSSMRHTFEEYFSRPEAKRLVGNQSNTVFLPLGLQLLVVPITVQDKRIAYLVLDMEQSEMLDLDMIAFAQAGSMVAVEFLNEQALLQREQKIREQLLEDLLMKRYSDEKMVIKRGRYLGFDMTGPYCIFTIDAESFEETLKNEMASYNEEKVQQIKTQITQKIRTGMGAYHRPCLVLDSSVGAVGMISVRKEADVQDCAKILADIMAELHKLNTTLSFSAGIGRIKQGIQQVEQCRQEALLAMRAGRHIPGRPRTRVYSFQELGCLCFLSELDGSQAMRDFYEEHMLALLEYDKTHNAELIKTLDAYFTCGCNLRKTAENLFVHKNSVLYRLGKVEALLGMKLAHASTAFDLQLCLKLRNLMTPAEPLR